MANPLTTNYGWEFPETAETLTASNALLYSIATDLDTRLFRLDRPLLKEDWSDFAATEKDLVLLNSNVAGKTVTLPDTPYNGFHVDFLDIEGTSATNIVHVVTAGSDTIMGSSDGLDIDSNFASFRLIYITSLTDWRIM